MVLRPTTDHYQPRRSSTHPHLQLPLPRTEENVASFTSSQSPSSGPPIQTKSSPPPIVGIKCWIQSTR